MNDKKSEIGKQENLNPQEAIDQKDMKKVLKSMLSLEHFIDLNVKIIYQEKKIIQQDEKIIQQGEQIFKYEE